MDGDGQGPGDALCRMRSLVEQHGRDGAAAWLEAAVQKIRANGLGSVPVALARCGRKVGDAPLESFELPGWTARDAARTAIVLEAFASSSQVPAAYGQWLRRGEQGEQVSLLRMLPLLPEPALLVEHAIDACRTNSEVVFRAVACHNPFPAAHFPPLHFNQLVLKAIFLGVPVSEISGLQARIDAQLLRMADDFAAEREAAGRPVPEDISLLHELAPR